jgi:hypothetical protein
MQIKGMYNWQRLIVCFLCKEGAIPSDIHRRISAVFGQKAPARSTVFSWARSFDSGRRTAQSAVSVRYSYGLKACFREPIWNLTVGRKPCIYF